MLRAKQIETFYGDIQALKGVSLEVGRGEIVTMVGSNGAGKTTLLNTISGILKTSKGKILFEDLDITDCTASQRVSVGITQVPEGRHVFPTLTVKDNLILGAFIRIKGGHEREVEKDYEAIFVLFPILKERRKQKAGTLSGGEQQMLSIGRALMAKPKLVLLDEPSMGLAPLIKKTIFTTIKELKMRGLTLLLVEQDSEAALSIADKGYVMQNGQIVLEDRSDRLLKNPQIREIYFGKSQIERGK